MGWGFLNQPVNKKNQVRIFSTLWALRALAFTDYVSSQDYKETLCYVIRNSPSHCVGFTYNDAPKIITTSMLLILSFELGSTSLSTFCTSSLNINAMVNYLLCSITSFRNSETEEFLYPSAGAEKLSWIHISLGVAIQALSLYSSFLTTIQKLKLKGIVKKALKNNWNEEGWFYDDSIPFDKSNPKTFPTSYFCMGLNHYKTFVIQSLTVEAKTHEK